MGKRKKAHEEHANHERWLVSYADFITLLFAFFVVLFSSSQVDRSKTNKMALAIQAAFSEFSMFEKTGGEYNLFATNKGKPASARSSMLTHEGVPIFMNARIEEDETGLVTKNFKGDPSLSENSGMPTPESVALERARQDVMHVLEKEKVTDAVEVNLEENGVVIRLKDAVLFEEGVEQMTAKSKDVLMSVAGILAKLPNEIRVEGHSDPVEGSRFASNWELSAARAAHVADFLVKRAHIDPKRFTVVGYGEYRPLASNDTKEGRSKNRRVDLILMSSKVAQERYPTTMPKPTSEKIKTIVPGEEALETSPQGDE